MRSPTKTWLTSLAVTAACVQTALAGEYFDPGLLQAVNGNAAIADTRALSQGFQPAGIYRVHVNVNDQSVMVSDVRFEADNKKQLVACLSYQDYQKLGVDMSKLNAKAEDNALKNTCLPIEEQVPGSKSNFDFSKLQLDISLPQTVLRDETLTGVPVEEWDDGIPALISMYQLSGQQYITHHGDTADSIYANLTNGFNLGRWRYRNNSTMSKEDGWKNITNYVETAVRSLKGELTFGDASTPSDVFDSVMVRGAQLSSDDDMIPDQLTGFAPLIRGIAKSNARVTVRENGNVIYQRSVPPGPFVISDLSSVSNGGKLDVTITEADGSESHSTISYSNVPQLLRTGQIKYSLVAGRYLSGDNAVEKDPDIVQATLSWGLPLNTTLYGGSQYHERYQAYSLGLGFDLQRAGGIALDVTRSNSRRRASQENSGEMLRLTYRNSIPETDTQIQIDSRYYLNDYLSFNDWAESHELFDDSTKRREYNMTINQSITSEHSFFATVSRSENADSSVSRMWQLGWNGAWRSASFSLAYSMTRDNGAAEWDKQLALTLSIPFSEMFPNAQPMVNMTTMSGLKDDVSQQVGITGRVGDRQDLTWNTQVSYAHQNGQDDTKSGSAGLNYQGRYGDMDATWYTGDNQYLSWNASGNIIAHRHGITAGRYSSGSQALVAIPGAPDVVLDSGQHTITDSRGYAIAPDLRAYHRNPLRVDTQTSKQVDFTSTATQVVPTKDAVVLAQFTAITGHKMVLTVKHNGEYLPFGARARIEGNDATYYVGDQGQVYLNAAPEKGTVTFDWGEKQQCAAPFIIPASDTTLPLALLSVNCQ
ncbi:fimbria/pilus outer membrane usher protein [Atlantibacter sp.]|uniref:fimbria/pilus outer membrane usher protein n=1 Tax=Atlantibacter sp. TaxID=1903473 RepID=UPI0028AC1583|nr:fimbria/pilus outer membrane usher protein [Atlantibacter sp.]